jgi:hypothetical protein
LVHLRHSLERTSWVGQCHRSRHGQLVCQVGQEDLKYEFINTIYDDFETKLLFFRLLLFDDSYFKTPQPRHLNCRCYRCRLDRIYGVYTAWTIFKWGYLSHWVTLVSTIVDNNGSRVNPAYVFKELKDLLHIRCPLLCYQVSTDEKNTYKILHISRFYLIYVQNVLQ